MFQNISVSVAHMKSLSNFCCSAIRDLAVSWTSSADRMILEFSALSLLGSMRSARTSMNKLKSVRLLGEPCGTHLVILAKLVELDPTHFDL